LILPQSKATPAPQLASDQANRDRPLAREDGELGVRHHHFAEGVEH